MKSPILFIQIFVLVLVVSCSMVNPSREITVVIPEHPWERATGESLWYTLRWTDGKSLNSMHISSDERVVSIRVPIGETVLIAAFPLGDMNPFGGSVTPLDASDRVVLTQNDGVLVSALMDIDLSVTHQLNYGKLKAEILRHTSDFRCLDVFVLLRDLQNGELDTVSIRTVDMFGIDEFALPNGIWISEFLSDASFVVTENLTLQSQLPEGVYRYLNAEMDRVLVVVVDSKGDSYQYMKEYLH